MLKRKTISASGAQRGGDQPTPQMIPGGPVRGINVKLGQNPGGQAVARTTTDADGKFKFSVVPKGEYLLTVEVSERLQTQLGQLNSDSAPSGNSRLDGKIDSLLIAISDASGKRGIGWHLERNQAFDPLALDSTRQSTARYSAAQFGSSGRKQPNLIVSDGATPCEGAINTSRSNIKSL
jgi:hypothetical protein